MITSNLTKQKDLQTLQIYELAIEDNAFLSSSYIDKAPYVVRTHSDHPTGRDKQCGGVRQVDLLDAQQRKVGEQTRCGDI